MLRNEKKTHKGCYVSFYPARQECQANEKVSRTQQSPLQPVFDLVGRGSKAGGKARFVTRSSNGYEGD